MKMNEIDDFKLLKFRIKRKFGINVEQYRESFLRRRVNTRLHANGLSNCTEYLKFLETHPEEYPKLAKALTINVSEFFRDAEVWKELENILKKMMEKKTMIRSLSAGCATGEEAYTLTILLNEILETKNEILETKDMKRYYIRTYAVDIDENVIEFAKKGTYAKIKGHEKWFDHKEEGYLVKDEIKKLVKFEVKDIREPLDHKLLDIVLFRNVLIYFEKETHEKILKNIYHSLKPEGYLVLSLVETMPNGLKNLFLPYNSKLKIFQKTACQP